MMENPFEKIQFDINQLRKEISTLSFVVKGKVAQNPDKEYYKLSEVIDILKISKSTVRKLLQDGRLSSIKRGKTIYVSRKALDDYMDINVKIL